MRAICLSCNNAAEWHDVQGRISLGCHTCKYVIHNVPSWAWDYQPSNDHAYIEIEKHFTDGFFIRTVGLIDFELAEAFTGRMSVAAECGDTPDVWGYDGDG